jgi:hypothetical protein
MDGTSRPEGKVFIPSHQPHSIWEIDLQRKKPPVRELLSEEGVPLQRDCGAALNGRLMGEPTVGLPYVIMKNFLKKLLHIEDTPERTALAFSVGIFLGFSPFLGLHTLGGLAIAFLFRLNRVAILLGVWSNTPWWIVPYYTIATWLGMRVMRFRIDWRALQEIFQLGKDQGFISSGFWSHVASQWGLLLSFIIGSLILAILLSLVAYPLSLRWIRFYRSRRETTCP